MLRFNDGTPMHLQGSMALASNVKKHASLAGAPMHKNLDSEVQDIASSTSAMCCTMTSSTRGIRDYLEKNSAT
jgi:hypothetical protein